MADLRAVRLGDFVVSTCDGTSSGPFIQGSFNTFVNGRPQVRLLDRAIPGNAITGSLNTFVNNKPAVRVQDLVSCGKTVTGSFNTFIR